MAAAIITTLLLDPTCIHMQQLLLLAHSQSFLVKAVAKR